MTNTFKQPTSFNLRRLALPEHPTLRIDTAHISERRTERLEAGRLRELHEHTTLKLPAITQPLAALQTTQQLPALADEDVTDKRAAIRHPLLCQIEEFAREDGVTPFGYIARLLQDDYRRRIARDVEELL